MIIKNGNQVKIKTNIPVRIKRVFRINTKSVRLLQLDTTVNYTAWKINPILPSKG